MHFSKNDSWEVIVMTRLNVFVVSQKYIFPPSTFVICIRMVKVQCNARWHC